MSTATTSQRETESTRQNWAISAMNNACSMAQVNVGDTERAISTLAGGALILLAPRNLPGWILKAMGCGLLYRGITGHCFVYQGLETNTMS